MNPEPEGEVKAKKQRTNSPGIEENAGEEDVEAPLEIESLCMNCYENGTTRLMSTVIPFYKQVLLMSFECPHCGTRNNEIQSGEPCLEHGVEIALQVHTPEDLNRSVVKSEYASIEVPQVELLIPPKSQPGEVTTVEGVLDRTITALKQDQAERRQVDAEQAEKIDTFVARLAVLRELGEKWTLKLRDPSGNSFIQNPYPSQVDPRCVITRYPRTLEDTRLLGLIADDVADAAAAKAAAEEDMPLVTTSEEWQSYDDCKGEVLHFPGTCQSCGARVETLMKPTDIPHFQTVIIMASHCDQCGYKYNEVKSGGETQAMGCLLTLKIQEDIDMARDVLKSDTCALRIPQLELDVGAGALSSRFTTVEGILRAVREQLEEQSNFLVGDSSTANQGQRAKFEQLFQRLDDVIELRERGVVLELDDPAGNSYVMSLNAPLTDTRLEKHFYERSYEQNEELGLNDMRVEDYAEESKMETIAEEEGEEAATTKDDPSAAV